MRLVVPYGASGKVRVVNSVCSPRAVRGTSVLAVGHGLWVGIPGQCSPA